MKQSSLSRNLFIRIAPMIAVTIIFIGGFAFYSADKEITTVYDAQLISNANVLWTLVSDELSEDEDRTPKKVADVDLSISRDLAYNEAADDYADSRMFRVWKSGRIMMFSDTALPATIPMQQVGFSIVRYQGELWRIYTLPINTRDHVTIEVGEKLALRNTLVAHILLNLGAPLLLLVPVVGLLLWFGIISGLGSIRDLVEQIRRRSPDDLSPVDVDALPRDLAPLAKSLNQLLIKLTHSFAAEKRFTDHAAHQLKTPQAAIKLQLQMLAKATTEAEKKALISDLTQSNERASKLITMLLTSARLGHQSISLQPVAAYSITALVMAELGLLAKERGIDLLLEGDEECTALADEALLKLMMHNLIENAIKYTPAHGHVRVHVARKANTCQLLVEDTGCGIAEEERALVFERFYRIATPMEEGSGLGLAIVAEIIERLGGAITLKTPENGQGLRIEVTLPIPSSIS